MKKWLKKIKNLNIKWQLTTLFFALTIFALNFWSMELLEWLSLLEKPLEINEILTTIEEIEEKNHYGKKQTGKGI